jgi:hypothetical protein
MALQTTPFRFVYGRNQLTLMSYMPGLARVAALDKQLLQRDEFLGEVRERLLLAQDYMKASYEKAHRAVQFAVGDWVLLRLHHRSASGITDRAQAKLAPKFFRPFQVLECIGTMAYRLKLPPKVRIHDVFHVAFLKKFEGVPLATPARLPPLAHWRVLPVPAKVLRAHSTPSSWELLVKWVGLDTVDASWEPLEEFKEKYPNFKLEDELFRLAGGSVKDSMFGKKFRRGKDKSQAPNSG